MPDIHIYIRPRLTPALRRWGLLGLLLAGYAPELSSDSVTLSTYYPAPLGSFSQLTTAGSAYLARSGGKVGIGTTTPGAKLEVGTLGRIHPTGDGSVVISTGSALFVDGGYSASTSTYIKAPSANNIAFYNNSSVARMTIADSSKNGAIGIGAAPAATSTVGSNVLLEVGGTIRSRQTGCTVVKPDSCGGYPSLMAGFRSEKFVSTGYIDMACCPCGGASYCP